MLAGSRTPVAGGRSGNRVVAAWIASLAVIALTIAWWHSLPTPLFSEPWSTVAYARDGTLLGAQIAADGQWRFPPAKVPGKFEAALLAYEDKRFYEHHGIDTLALLRALGTDLAERRVVSGGSTLTMQTVRIARGREGSRLYAKLVETLLAPRLELRFSKREILALYAAHAPFGANVVGLEAAAWRYFGRAPDQLSWSETCTLAVLPNSPALVHPGRQRTVLKEKRDLLLRRLYARGILDASDLELAVIEPLTEAPAPLPQLAPHLLATLSQRTPAQHRFATTIDASLQRAVNDIVAVQADILDKQDIRNLAVLVLDNRSFEVLAYVGNSRWSFADETGYAVDVVQRPRSTGSILKPFLYAAMLESGDLAPRMLVPDVPSQFGGYMPENYDRTYRGAVPADVALAQSLNVPAVRMLRDFGVARFEDVLKGLGLSTLYRTPDEYGLALILGGAEGTLWELTQAYANLVHIARDSIATAPVTYRRATWTLPIEAKSGPARDIGPAAAWLTLRALTEVARPGDEGHWRNFTSTRAIAWKTGTSWGLRDAWAIGSTSRYTIGVWAGNANGAGRPGLIGGVAAAPILFSIVRRLEDSAPIPPPLWALKSERVCLNDGYLANADCDTRLDLFPRNSHFDRVSPHNLRIHLDSSERRVDSSCESVTTMQHRSWFVLAPVQEYYFRRAHSEYRVLPAYRSDCGVAAEAREPMEFVYPSPDARVYIPVDFGARRSGVVFEAAHRDPEAQLFWHLDGRFVGSTTTFHTQTIDVEPGSHVLTLVDQNGARRSRRFEVIGADVTRDATRETRSESEPETTRF